MFPYPGLWYHYPGINNKIVLHLNLLTSQSTLVNGLIIGNFGIPSYHDKVEAISYQEKAILIDVTVEVNVY